MHRQLTGVLVCLLVCVQVVSAKEIRLGNFRILIEKDRFSEKSTILASTQNKQYDSLAFRCLSYKSISIYKYSLGRGRWEEGMTGTVQIKIDKFPVFSANVVAINDKIVQIDDSKIWNLVANASEIAFRLTVKDVMTDMIFPLQKVKDVVSLVSNGCEKAIDLEKTDNPIVQSEVPVSKPNIVIDDRMFSPTELKILEPILTIYSASAYCKNFLIDSISVDKYIKDNFSSKIFSRTEWSATISAINIYTDLIKAADVIDDSSKRSTFCNIILSNYGRNGSLTRGLIRELLVNPE